MTVLTVNGVNQVVDAPGDTRLLWVIREHLRLTGTKFGCGLGPVSYTHLTLPTKA